MLLRSSWRSLRAGYGLNKGIQQRSVHIGEANVLKSLVDTNCDEYKVIFSEDCYVNDLIKVN